MNLKHNYIERCFADLAKLKYNGIWFSGKNGEGEFKNWYLNLKHAYTHCFYKNNERHGEYKIYDEFGNLSVHKLFKNGESVKDYLK